MEANTGSGTGKKVLIGVGITALLVVGILVYSKSKAATSTPQLLGYDPSTGQPIYSIPKPVSSGTTSNPAASLGSLISQLGQKISNAIKPSKSGGGGGGGSSSGGGSAAAPKPKPTTAQQQAAQQLAQQQADYNTWYAQASQMFANNPGVSGDQVDYNWYGYGSLQESIDAHDQAFQDYLDNYQVVLPDQNQNYETPDYLLGGIDDGGIPWN